MPATFTGSARVGYGGRTTLKGSSISTSDAGRIPTGIISLPNQPAKGDIVNISDVYACICSIINQYSKAAYMTSRWYYLYYKKKSLVSTVSGYGLHNSVNNNVSEDNVTSSHASPKDIIKAEHVNAAISQLFNHWKARVPQMDEGYVYETTQGQYTCHSNCHSNYDNRVRR